jgi:hypothetical protein
MLPEGAAPARCRLHHRDIPLFVSFRFCSGMLIARRQCTPSPKTSSFVAFAPMRVSASRRAKRICLVATSYGGTSGSKTSTGTILKPKLSCQNGSHLKRFPERWICGTTAAAACNAHCNFSCCAAATPLIFKMHPLQRNTSQLVLLSQAQRKMHLVISSLLHFTIERKVEIYSSASTVRAKIIPKHSIFSFCQQHTTSVCGTFALQGAALIGGSCG